MTFEHDIFTFYAYYDYRTLIIKMTEYQPETGDRVILNEPVDMTYVVSDEVYNEAKDLLSEYEEDN